MIPQAEPSAGSSSRPAPAPAAGAHPERASLEQLEVQVAGLSCVLCARRLEEYLRRQHGVESALVNPRTGRLRVRFRAHEVSAANLFVEVRRAGFTPGGATAHLRVSGMHCASCAAAVERALLRQTGVERVVVNLEAGDVHVDYLPEKADPAKLVKAVSLLGFRAEAAAEVRQEEIAVPPDAGAEFHEKPPAAAVGQTGDAAGATTSRRPSLLDRFRSLLKRRKTS